MRCSQAVVLSLVSTLGIASAAAAEPALSAGDLFRQGAAGAPGAFAPESLSAAFSLPSLGGQVAASSMGQGDDDVSGYMAFRAGPIWFQGDVDELDVGLDAEVAIGWQPIGLVAVEIFSGFLRGEETSGSVENELWGIPLGVKAKVLIPIFLFLRVYGGAGIAGYYFETETDLGAVEVDEDDFVAGGEAFIGLQFRFTRFIMGIEGQYMYTDELELGTEDVNVEGASLLGWVGFRF